MPFIIQDDYKLTFSDKEIQRVKDTYVANPSNGIFVRIQATHAGLVNRNNFFYLPDKMKDSVGSFLTPFAKPILVNHNEEGEPIGRVVAAKYVDTSLSLKDGVSELVDKFSLVDKEFRNFITGEMSLDDQVKYISDTLYDKMLSDPNFTGLGYAEIVAHITDAAAIEKFLDGRYLTGSVSASTDKAICSVCKEDWSEGRCDHSPGKLYDKKKMFLIAGKFGYEHWAVVNTPADGHSKATEVSSVPLNDAVDTAQYTLQDISVELLNSYSEEGETEMKIEDSEKTVQNNQVTSELVPEQIPEVQVQDESFDDFLTRVLDKTSKLTDEDLEKVYQLMLDAMKEIELEEQVIADAKLTTEKRKSLAKSTFCGPGKSFPVPDCAHVVAARKLIGRYKGPGDKEAILACVSRKAKSMGCDKEKMKDAIQEPTQAEILQTQTQDGMTHVNVLSQLLEIVRSQQWASMEHKPLTEEQMGMLQELISAIAQLATVEEVADAVLSEKGGLSQILSDKLESSLLDEVVKLETSLGEVRDEFEKSKVEVETLKDEIKVISQETEILRDSTVQAKTQYREIRADYLTLLRSLKDHSLIKREDLMNLEDSALNSELDSLVKELDLLKIVEKLDDGMARNPTGTVENPIQIVDNSKENATITVEGVAKELRHIEETFIAMSLKNSISANNYLAKEMARMKKEGKLPN